MVLSVELSVEAMTYTIAEIPELSRYTIEWAEPGNYYLSRRNQIFHSATLNPPFKPIAHIDAPFWKQAASNFRLAQRLLRFLVTNVIPLNNGDIFITFDKSIGIIRDGKYQPLKGLTRPCRVLRSACAVGKSGEIFFGEYLANNERGPMNVYRYTPGNDEVEAVYTFPGNSVKHVHGIYFDPFTDSLFCLTGDDLNECRILKTSDAFKTVEVIGEGDETWRAVSLLFSKDAIVYGTDAEFRTNHIYRFDRNTSERSILGEVDGTVFYSKNLGDDLFFATTAENAPSQKENVAVIWHVSNDLKLKEIARFKKDGWHGTLFMFGTIHFPAGKFDENELFFSLVGVEGDDHTYRVLRT